MGKIKNLSLRKTIVLYMIISLIISFYLSALIMRIASTVQNNIWWNYLADNMLYKSGSYEISNKAEAVLSKIAKIIQDYKDYDVLVEGNTDTDPISRTNIRNNWDLSALRASSVVQALQNIYGINPKRLTAAGRGEFNPVAGNDTAEGKARNRRTEIIITPKLDQFMDLIDQAPDNSSSGIMGDENTKE